jgi:putative redox protein
MPPHHFSITLSATPHADSVVFTGLPDTSSAPMQGMVVALGQCTILTLHSICQRQRQPVQQYRCTITANQRDPYPQIFASITMQMQVIGYTLDPKRMAQAWHLVPNYCPVHATIALSCPITHHITLEEPA